MKNKNSYIPLNMDSVKKKKLKKISFSDATKGVVPIPWEASNKTEITRKDI